MKEVERKLIKQEGEKMEEIVVFKEVREFLKRENLPADGLPWYFMKGFGTSWALILWMFLMKH